MRAQIAPKQREPGFMFVLILALFLSGSGVAQDWEMRVCADPNRMPFSHREELGFDNRIAEILADELGAKLTFVWWPTLEAMIFERLREGECDLIIGVPDGHEPLLTTVTYYRSPYVFIYRVDSPFDIESLDDPVLRELDIGVEEVGIAPHQALLNRGLAQNVVRLYWNQELRRRPDHLSPLIEAVANGEVDVGLAWGPVAGYYAPRQTVELKVVPVTPEIDPPFRSMSVPMTIGVRRGDDALRDRLGIALANRWDEVQEVLQAYEVPILPVPRPTAALGGR